jgi:hypothetical protein
METQIGSKVYESIEISVDTAVDIGTGFKKGDDFKVFSFRDITLEVPIGTMFKTDMDYWLCVNSNGYASPTNSCEVRRCNNIMKWIDPNTGVVNEQYCVIDYELSSPRPRHDKDINVADGHIFAIVQGSDLTRSIEKNQRFIFNGQPYKFSAEQSLLNTNDDTKDTLLYMDMYLDMIQPDDDLVNGIANATDYVYTIDVQADVSSQVDGYTGQLSANVYLNGDVVNRDIVWSCNKYADITDDGEYTLSKKDGNIAVFTATLKGNDNVSASCSVEIVESMEGVSDKVLIINPLYSEVRQKQPITFDVYLYNNGVRQDDAITWSFSGVNSNYFTMVQDGHTFTLSVKNLSANPLELTFSAQDISKSIDIMLKPFF